MKKKLQLWTEKSFKTEQSIFYYSSRVQEPYVAKELNFNF